MYAVIRETTLRPGSTDQASAAREQFAAIRAQQPGFQGALTIDAGGGRTVTVVLWESEQANTTASPTLQPQAEKLLYPFSAEPPRIVYQGNVIANDLTNP